MPIYEYKCLECEEEFETIVLGGDEGIECPRCRGDRLERMMSACGFRSGHESAPSTASPGGCSSCSSTNCSSCH